MKENLQVVCCLWHSLPLYVCANVLLVGKCSAANKFINLMYEIIVYELSAQRDINKKK